jgi:hypothetical protein
MDNNTIPPFTEKGYLPPGIWAMSWSEFCDRYGYNSRRINLLSGLMSALKLLIRSGCDEVYIGGSFITSKERPNDIDGCFDGVGIDVSLLDSAFDDLDKQQTLFGCELRLDFMSAFQGFLQSDRNGQPIGIVALDLNSLLQTGGES